MTTQVPNIWRTFVVNGTRLAVIAPNDRLKKRAADLLSQTYIDLVRSGCPTEADAYEALRGHGLWDDDCTARKQRLNDAISEAEIALIHESLDAEERYHVGLQIERDREELKLLMAPANVLLDTCAEAKAFEAFWDFLVDESTIYVSNNRLYFRTKHRAVDDLARDPARQAIFDFMHGRPPLSC